MGLFGWIIYNANLGGKFLDHAKIFLESARRHGMSAEIVPNDGLLSRMDAAGQPAVIGISEHLKQRPDFVLFWDKDIYLARQLEKIGIPVFNPSSAIEVCDDKCATYQALSTHGITMPKTIIAPRIFAWSGVRNVAYYDRVAEEIGFPMVVKEAFGSFGSQVYLIQNKESMMEKVQELDNIPYLFQEFIKSSFGTDVRLQVVGDRVVAAMRRVSDDDFRANCGKGATPFPHTPTRQQAELAIRAAKIVGAGFAGVDLLFGPDGEPILCEVNSNAHIVNLAKATGINVADDMLLYIKEQVLGAKQQVLQGQD